MRPRSSHDPHNVFDNFVVVKPYIIQDFGQKYHKSLGLVLEIGGLTLFFVVLIAFS